MSLSFYDISVPTFLGSLRNLSAILGKGEAHSVANGVDLAAYVTARLAPDMLPFSNQIQLASDAAKSGVARLAQITAPSFPDVETTFPELRERLSKTIAFLESVDRAAIDGGEARIVELKLPNRTLSFTGQDYLFQFALPNFFFHVVTAYDLLRSQGVPIGKMDYLAAGNPSAAT